MYALFALLPCSLFQPNLAITKHPSISNQAISVNIKSQQYSLAVMHILAFLASLRLLAPALAAPLSANVEISINDETPSSVSASVSTSNKQDPFEYCQPRTFHPDFPCEDIIGKGWVSRILPTWSQSGALI